MEVLVLGFLIGRWSVHLVGGRLVDWSVVGGRSVGGFKKPQNQTTLQRKQISKVT